MEYEILQRIPIKDMRKIIGQRMRRSVQEKPQVTLHTEFVADKLLAFKESVAETLRVNTGMKPSLTHLLIKLTAIALTRKPELNGHVLESEIVLYRDVNIGCAVALDHGLIVPVVHKANRKSLSEISAEMRELEAAAREGTLKPNQIMDATFTITNLGPFGITHFSPIVNPPEIAILGVNTIRTLPVLNEGRLQQQLVMTLSLSFDHAAVDGALAAMFLQELVSILSNPSIEYCDIGIN